jgi:hypothetical protein
LGDLVGIVRVRQDLQAALVIGVTDLGQPSVRAAAEKPPLSTTLTKVAMLVMRSMRSPDHAVKPTEMFRHFRLIKLAAITFAHIFGRRECGLPRDGRLAGHAGLARPNQGLWNPLVFARPAFRRPERILRHACRVPHRSVLGSVEVGTRATQETHAFDDDGSIIGGIGLVDDRAFASDAVGRELMAGADPNAASERISACFLREQHQGRKHDRGRGDEGLS